MKKVLIVGGAGYVGGGTIDFLTEAGYELRVYDNLLYEDSYRKPVEFIFGDVRDTEKIKPHLDWADVVVWLAALVGDGACQLNPALTVAINQKSVKWLSENYDGRIIFTSTCSVYGAQDRELAEESNTNPLSLYAITKLKAESYLGDKNAIIFRLGTLFGVSDTYARIRMDLVVNILTARAYSLKKIEVFGGDQYRPLLHVNDVARAILTTMESDITGVYNLRRRNIKIIDLAWMVQTHFPDTKVESTEMPFQDTRNYRVSTEKIKKAFEFHPAFSIDKGIEEIKELVESGRIKNINNNRFSNQHYLEEHTLE